MTVRDRAPRSEYGAPPLRLVVADDHALDRAGLSSLLAGAGGFDVIAETGTLEETLERCAALQPDVLVLALKIHGQDHDAAIPALRARLPELRILAISERSIDHCLVLNPPWRKALRDVPAGAKPDAMDCLQVAAHQGALGTLRRTADPEDLFLAVRLVAQGDPSYDTKTAMSVLAESTGTNARAGHAPQLSTREMQVAALIAEAHSNKEIAALLGIREPTVKKHVRHILEKLGVQDRLQAGLFLARHPLQLEP